MLTGATTGAGAGTIARAEIPSARAALGVRRSRSSMAAVGAPRMTTALRTTRRRRRRELVSKLRRHRRPR